MRNTFRILFYLKRTSSLRNGMVPVMARITINGQRAQLSTHLYVNPVSWDTQPGRVKGNSRQAAQINQSLESLRYHLTGCYERLFYQSPFITPMMVKTEFLGQDSNKKNLLAFFASHNEHFARMVGVNRSVNTYYKYRSVYIHLRKYIQERYLRSDMALAEVTTDFVTGFHAFIRHRSGCSANTAWIYLIAFKHVLMLAVREGVMRGNPFANYKLCSEYVSRNYLTQDEIGRMLALTLRDSTLCLVRDAFLFSCFTGLSYIDMRKLDRSNLEQFDGRRWIRTKRSKTGVPVSVRLFDLPAAILEKYGKYPDDGPLFNLPSNGWCNMCLDKIARLANIRKKVTFHVARHTFATTITLSQGVTIETISKLLGHKNIRTTQIYAAVTHDKLNGEMEQLSRRIDALFGQTNMQRESGL